MQAWGRQAQVKAAAARRHNEPMGFAYSRQRGRADTPRMRTRSALTTLALVLPVSPAALASACVEARPTTRAKARSRGCRPPAPALPTVVPAALQILESQAAGLYGTGVVAAAFSNACSPFTPRRNSAGAPWTSSSSPPAAHASSGANCPRCSPPDHALSDWRLESIHVRAKAQEKELTLLPESDRCA
jgi:hypothetical protein